MLHALRSLFVVTSGIAVAIVLFAGCEPVLPEDTSTDAGHVESYVGSYIAVGRSVEATLDVSRDRFTMVALNLGSVAAVRGRAAASSGPAWYIVDGKVTPHGGGVQFEVTGTEINRASSDTGCAPILVPDGSGVHDAAVGELLECLGVEQKVSAERLDPRYMAVGAWVEMPSSSSQQPSLVELGFTINSDGTAVLRQTQIAHETIDFLEFTMGVKLTATTLAFKPITAVRGVLKDGTEVDGAEYLDYYNEQIDAYRDHVVIHYTVTDAFMSWDYEVFGADSPFAGPLEVLRFVRIN